MPTIIAISGSYRAGGVHEQLVQEVLAGAAEAGAETRFVALRETDIAFCTNCRTCTQQPGDEPGKCVHDDAMTELLPACLRADGLVLASPINMSEVTAVFKRFMERFTPTAYWPWNGAAPGTRKCSTPKRAVLVCASAAPRFVWGLGGFHALGTLRYFAKTLSARVVRELTYGMMAREQHYQLNEAQRLAAREAGRLLVK